MSTLTSGAPIRSHAVPGGSAVSTSVHRRYVPTGCTRLTTSVTTVADASAGCTLDVAAPVPTGSAQAPSAITPTSSDRDARRIPRA